MPVQRKYDMYGPYYQYGHTGTKYRYLPNNKASRIKAFNKAKLQERAIILSRAYR